MEAKSKYPCCIRGKDEDADSEDVKMQPTVVALSSSLNYPRFQLNTRPLVMMVSSSKMDFSSGENPIHRINMEHGGSLEFGSQ